MVCAEITFGPPRGEPEAGHTAAPTEGKGHVQNRGENGLQGDSSRESKDSALGARGVRSAGVSGRIVAGAGLSACNTARIHRRRREAVPFLGDIDAMCRPVAHFHGAGFRRVVGSEAFVFMQA